MDLAQYADTDHPATLRSRRGLLQIVLGCSAWLVVLPLLSLTQAPPLGGSYLSLPLWLTALLIAALVSTTTILVACLRRSWGVALVSLALAATAMVVVTRQSSPTDYVDDQYRAHRTALADLVRDYRAGRLDGDLTLPPELRSLCPSGFAYADATAVFVQMWQNWRAESGTGLAYFAAPPTDQTLIQTASGDHGHPRREVGDGWWWVA